MTRQIVATLVLVLVTMVLVLAQEPLLINYQGQLADSSGNPVPDDNYFLTFKLYNDSTGLSNPFWTETHPRVSTSDGLFQVQLGSVTPFNPSTLGEEPLFLEIQVGDQLLLPRMRFTAVPNAVYAQRLKGDIVTEPGSFLFRSALGDSAISMLADGTVNALKINWPDPPEMTSSAIELANVGNNGSRIWMYHPLADPPGPMIEINADPIAGSSIIIHSAEPLLGGSGVFRGTPTSGAVLTLNTNPAPHEQIKVIEMSSESPDGGSFKMFNSQLEPPPVLMEMSTSFNTRELGANFTMFNPNLEYLDEPLVEVSTRISTGASLRMFNPQPEPPHDPVLEMSTGIGGQGSFRMFNPQPEPPNDPMVEMSTIPGSSASFRMFNPQPEPPHDPVLEMSTGIGGQGSFKMFNPQPEPPHDPMVEISTTPGSSASFKMFNPQPEPPGNDPFLEMSTGLHGVNFRLSSPQVGRQVGNAIEMVTSDSGGTMLFYDEFGNHVWMNIDPDGQDGDVRLFNPDGGVTVRISSQGKIGIGTDTPTVPLDVNGTAKMTGFQMPTGAVNGYVLTSNDSGIGSWQAAAGGSDGDWTIVGSNMYSNVTGNIGIGTTSPARKLHINDVMRLQPRTSFPTSPGEGDICIVNITGVGNHIYCYLNSGWRQLD